MTSSILSVLLIAVLVVIVVVQQPAEAQFRRVCYVTNWAQYRPDDGRFTPANIDPTLCSHIIYAFAVLNNDSTVKAYEFDDDGPGGLYEELNNLKKTNPALKTSIAIGGWNFGMVIVSYMLSTAASRKTFIDSAIQFARQRNFDGIDLDFEYPGDVDRDSVPEDKGYFVTLVQDLRTAIDLDAKQTGKAALILTLAVGAGKDAIDNGYVVTTLSNNVDWLNVMAYDMNGAWDNQTGLNAPLYPRSDELGNIRSYLNLYFAANYWLSLGADPMKLVLGMGTYGRCFTLKDSANNGLGAPVTGPCDEGKYTREAGFLSYYEICDMMKLPGAMTVYDAEQEAPYTYVGDQWVGYDNVQSLTLKVQFMMGNPFGGWIVWNMDLDDFTGTHCGAGPYPLMNALNKALNGATALPTTPAPTGATNTAATTKTTASPSGGSYRRICYVSNWAQYRPSDGMFKPNNIDPTLCSHINYAFAVLNKDFTVLPYEWNDDGPGGLYEMLNNLKLTNQGLTTSIAIGGWNFGMDLVTQMLSTAANRLVFVNDAVKFARQRNFDGIDLDFEYPGDVDRGSVPQDKDNFLALCQTLRAAIDTEAAQSGKTPLRLTVAVGVGKNIVDNGYDFPALSPNIDWFNVMAYDLNGAWDNQTGINAPLYARSDELGNIREYLNLDWAARYYVDRGCPKEKMMLGLGTYGRCFTLKNPADNGLGAPVTGPCLTGKYTGEAGFLSYYEICDMMKLPGAVTVYDAEQQVPYTYVGDQWVGYDNVQSLTLKANYMMSGGYGGWMAWVIDLDDFAGLHCGAGAYPLLKAMNQPVTGGTTGPTSPTTTVTTTKYTGPSTSPTTTPAPTTLPGQPFCTGKPSGLYKNLDDCSSFWNCANGSGALQYCTPDLYFDPTKGYCNWAEELPADRFDECFPN